MKGKILIISIMTLSLFIVGCSNENEIEKANHEEIEIQETYEKVEREVHEEVETQETQEAPIKETIKHEPSAIEVFEYAQGLFDSYTNYGENYVPEIHDDMVMKETAAHFGISVADADRLHYQGGMDSLN